MRMNVACPKELLYGGLDALKEGVALLKENKK
jgi:bifunctional pyridoxal-dependent enzyme with beta-cystathionase and maltose regulon repressor activities